MSATGDILKDARAALTAGVSMPAGFYTDPDFFADEKRSLLLGGWLFIGRDDEVANPGDYRAHETAGGPVIVIRGEDSVLRAFANFCRHRASLLLEGAGNCRRIVCPYHAWSYTTDGRLIAAPDMDRTPGFDKDAHGLIPLRLESWAGFVFVTFNRDAPALLDNLGDLPERMASHRPDELRCIWRVEIDCACNWKLLLENAMESYHTGTVHQMTVGAQTSRSIETRGGWRCIQVMSDRSIATMSDDAGKFDAIPGLDDDARQGTYFTVIHPTCQLVFAQDCAWWLNVVPKANDASVLEIGGCFPEATLTHPDFERIAAPYIERWEAVGREDVGILEKQQQGLASASHVPGPLSWRDDQVAALAAWVVENLAAA